MNTVNHASPLNGLSGSKPSPMQLEQMRQLRAMYVNLMSGLRLRHKDKPGNMWLEGSELLANMMGMLLAETVGNNPLLAQAASFELLSRTATKLQLTINAVSLAPQGKTQ